MTRTSKFLIAALVPAVILDFAHDLLNAWYRPFSGLVDDLMHLAWWPSMLLALASGVALSAAFVSHVRARFHTLHPLPFVALLGIEGLLARMRWRDAGASSYGPLTPDVLGGLLVGCACVYVARPLLHLRRVRWVATALLFLFASGTLTCDVVWHVERGARGTSWLWRVPAIGLFAKSYGAFFMHGGAPLEPWRGVRPFAGGALALAAAAFVASLPHGHRRIGLALTLAAGLAFLLLPAWSNFLRD